MVDRDADVCKQLRTRRRVQVSRPEGLELPESSDDQAYFVGRQVDRHALCEVVAHARSRYGDFPLPVDPRLCRTGNSDLSSGETRQARESEFLTEVKRALHSFLGW